uniref:Secreted protein n=1 Tax=Strongyloides venezuelensis TaxID=75913 RepID=A0A0K0G2F0_STRVS
MGPQQILKKIIYILMINLSLQIFFDSVAYILYVQSFNEVITFKECCEFTVNQAGSYYVAVVAPESLGTSTRESCIQFYVNQYASY